MIQQFLENDPYHSQVLESTDRFIFGFWNEHAQSMTVPQHAPHGDAAEARSMVTRLKPAAQQGYTAEARREEGGQQSVQLGNRSGTGAERRVRLQGKQPPRATQAPLPLELVRQERQVEEVGVGVVQVQDGRVPVVTAQAAQAHAWQRRLAMFRQRRSERAEEAERRGGYRDRDEGVRVEGLHERGRHGLLLAVRTTVTNGEPDRQQLRGAQGLQDAAERQGERPQDGDEGQRREVRHRTTA